MFKKSIEKTNGSTANNIRRKIVYDKPKILFIDIPEDVLDAVISEGFNVSRGTFGRPYKVELSDEYYPVKIKANLPNYTEREVIIINLTEPESTLKPEGKKYTSDGDTDLWAKCNRELIDPRPRVMYMIQEHFDRIFAYGGLFVIFSEPRIKQDLVWAKIQYRDFRIDQQSKIDNWSFLSVFDTENFDIQSDFGEEINFVNTDHEIAKWLKANLKGTQYNSCFEPSYRVEDHWNPLLTNKFGRTIAGFFKPDDFNGRILVLPQVKLTSKNILTLIKNVLPEISPHLFPYFEKYAWVERDDYELPSIVKIKNEKNELYKKISQDIKNLDKKIVDEREKYGFLHNMLIKTGEELVKSVKIYLNKIGFENVIDIDEDLKSLDKNVNKQEDLQIHDNSPTLLLEVKGIVGLPRESETLQVVKYIPRRMKEWGRTDVRGISIINHQKNIPGQERDNPIVFTKQQIEDANHSEITLMTTWDLFLLWKGMKKNGWDSKVIRDLFYKAGYSSRIPSSYKYIGVIYHFWDKQNVVGIEIRGVPLQLNQKIGYMLENDYLEEMVISIEKEGIQIDSAMPNDTVGIKTKYSKELLKNNVPVYLIE